MEKLFMSLSIFIILKHKLIFVMYSYDSVTMSCHFFVKNIFICYS